MAKPCMVALLSDLNSRAIDLQAHHVDAAESSDILHALVM